MSSDLRRAFFAYPSSPGSAGEAIRAAVAEINDLEQVKIQTWEELRISGNYVIERVLSAIDQADVFCVDLTDLNPNVLFELGYAIATNKRIWTIFDTTYADSSERLGKLSLLSSLGYTSYVNSKDIKKGFLSDRPHEDLSNTFFRNAIAPHLMGRTHDTVLYLKSRFDTEASVRITDRVGRSLPVVIDDPAESAVKSIAQYAKEIFAVEAVLCHFTSPRRIGSNLINSKYAFICGLSVGMQKPTLMLSEGEFLTPLDYRDLLHHYDNSRSAELRLDEWLLPFETAYAKFRAKKHLDSAQAARQNDLRSLDIGTYLAENESKDLVEKYFVETVAYRDALNGRHALFVGRKGAGKTALFLKLASTLRARATNIVCEIRPVAYELDGILALMKAYRSRDQKGFAIESLWKYLLYTEVAAAVLSDYDSRSGDYDPKVMVQLKKLMGDSRSPFRSSFPARLESCVQALKSVQDNSKTTEETAVSAGWLAISEALHSGMIKQLRDLLGSVLSTKQRVAILVDNLDKSWGKQQDLPNLSEVLLGLLTAASRLVTEFQKQDSRRQAMNLTLAVFMRSDIFSSLMKVAREPDKIQHTRLEWTDPILLRRIIEERYVASRTAEVNGSEMWSKFFASDVNGMPMRDFLTWSTLPRPRDLIFLVSAAIDVAINRRNAVVQSADVLEAHKLYSDFAVDSILVENGISIEQLEQVILEFAGNSSVLSEEQVRTSIAKTGIAQPKVDSVLDHLCLLSFLGLEVHENEFRFSDEPQELRRNQVLATKVSERSGQRRFAVHRAFWSYLDIPLKA